jgi:hypothetical protein
MAYASRSRTESSPGVPCALFAALEAKRHHPQLAASSALRLRRLCRVPCMPPAAVAPALLRLRFHCGLHELRNKQQEVDTAAAGN